MSARPASDARPHSVTLVVGRYDESIGGPFRTVAAYRKAAVKAGAEVRVINLQPVDPPPGAAGIQFSVTSPRGWVQLVSRLHGNRAAVTVVFGVWHPPFFVEGLLAKIRRRRRRRVLVPTASLSPFDWQKHARVKRLLAPLTTWLVRSFDVVVFATEGERRVARPSVGMTWAVIPEPIAEVRTTTRSAHDGLSLALLGRLAAEKDPELALRVLTELPSAQLHVIGTDSPDRVAELRALADRLSVSDRVRWHGWLPRDAAIDLVAGSTCLLVTSVTESYSHAAVEAMAAGVPVVMVDRVAPAADFAAAGVVVPAVATPQGVASAVMGLVRDPKRREQLVQRGVAYAGERMGDHGLDSVAMVMFDGLAGRKQ